MVLGEFFFDYEVINYLLMESINYEEYLVFDYITYNRVKLKKFSRIINSTYAYSIINSKIKKIIDEKKKALVLGRIENFFHFEDFSSIEEIKIDNTKIIGEEKEYITTLNKIYDMIYVVKDSSNFKELIDKGIKIISLSDFNKVITGDDDFKDWLIEEFK